MFERFTHRARAVVTAAEQHARATAASEVRPEHLLAALLDDPECLAVQVLAGLGAQPGRVREELDRHRARYVDGLDEEDADALRAIGIDLDEVVGRIDRNLGGLHPRPVRRPRFARGSRKTLELALREAIALHHSYIGTEHLMLGLARCDDRVVADTLAACGTDRSALRAAVVEATRRAG